MLFLMQPLMKMSNPAAELQRAQINAFRNANLNENEQSGDRAAEVPIRCFSE